MGQQQQYIHNVAKTVMGQVGLDHFSIGYNVDYWSECDNVGYPQMLWDRVGSKVMDVMRKMGPSARGRIAACGVHQGSSSGSLCHWNVNQGRDLDAAYSGDELLSLLASYVVVAAIVDILTAQANEFAREMRKSDEQYERAVDDYTHRGPRTGMPIPNASRYAH
jgi:hypothetical protein